MKNSILFNPFIKIAGGKALALGGIAYLISVFLSYITGTHHYGLFNIDFAKGTVLWIYFIELGTQWFILSLLLYLFGAILSKSKIRVIDVFGTILLAKIPLIITPLFRTIPYFQSFAIFSTAMFVVVGIYSITLIWTLVLLFNAFKVSCNLKQEKLIVSFILSIIISEILSKVILLQLK